MKGILTTPTNPQKKKERKKTEIQQSSCRENYSKQKSKQPIYSQPKLELSLSLFSQQRFRDKEQNVLGHSVALAGQQPTATTATNKRQVQTPATQAKKTPEKTHQLTVQM
jgi:hypothetical protein